MPAEARFELVEQRLLEYKSATAQVIDALLPNREPRRYLYDLVPEYPVRLGKGLRPGLCISTCKAFGGDLRSVVYSAASIELFHNAFLVHDDVEDGSLERRGKPTLNAMYGNGIAVNVGDAMNVLSLHPLMHNLERLGPTLSWLVFSEIEHMVRQSVEGQAMELGWVRDNECHITEADYLRMTLKKTCWYTCIHPCRIGAIVSFKGEVDPARFNRFGYYMGAGFQIQDDVLNLVGDQAKYGKEPAGDIWEGKRTLMLIHLLGNCAPVEHGRICEFLSIPREQRSETDVNWIVELMHGYGCIEHAKRCARELAGAALYEFGTVYRDATKTDDRQFIEDIIMYMIEREL
jgi:geranylgeranyl diphosphate synthase type II